MAAGNSTKLAFHLYNTMMILAGAVLVSMRSQDIGTDTKRYIRFLENAEHGISTRLDEPLFTLLAKFALLFGNEHPIFFFFVSFVSAIGLYCFFVSSARSQAAPPDKRMAIVSLALILTFISPIFWNFQTNILRAGLSVPFILLGANALHERARLRAGCFLLIACLFHSTAVLFAAAVYLVLAPAFVLWSLITIGSILYLTGLGQSLVFIVIDHLGGLVDISYHQKYFADIDGYRSGVRIDFYIFTLFFLMVSWSIRKHNEFAFKVYSALFMPFLGIGFISYSDRLLIYCWALIPLILSQAFTFYFVRYHRVIRQVAIPSLMIPLCFYLLITGAV